MKTMKKHVSVVGLLNRVHRSFLKVEDPLSVNVKIPLVDCLMSALAIFGMKMPSLLDFDEKRVDKYTKHNLHTLYQVDKTPCDTTMRERLDVIEPSKLRPVYTRLFSALQRSKALEPFAYYQGHYLLSVDGTGFFSSPTIHCEDCCIKQHGKCSVRLSKKPGAPTVFKKNTYFLFQEESTGWRLLFVDNDKEQSEITIQAVEGLAVLLRPSFKQLSKSDKIAIKEAITSYHWLANPDKKVTYYHQMLGAVLVHPDKKEVIPFCPEPILKQDGHTKNDCERNAAKRLLTSLRTEHPHLPLIIVEDALAANAPHIRLLKELKMKYILGVKPNDHKSLFDFVKSVWVDTDQKEERDKDGTIHRYHWVNGAPLNDSNPDIKVNFLEYWEISPKGKEQHFTWITDILLVPSTVQLTMKGGRARWHIENETYNTLKNQGYHFEHNYGHGYQHLSTVLAMLMFLAFLIDQIQQLCCAFFNSAWKKSKSKRSLWENIRALFTKFFIRSWEDLYNAIANAHYGGVLGDTS